MPEPLSSIADRLDALVEAFRVSSRSPSVSAGVVLGDSLAWSHSTGYADLEAGRLADARTLYRVASITKTITATAIVQLRDEGRLSLEDPVVRHVQEFAAARNPFGPIEQVTLRGLLTHTSGLQTDAPPSDPPPPLWEFPTRDGMLAMLDRVFVAVPPGSTHKYSNLGYELLGEVIRRVSGQSFDAYLRANILGPLGMDSTVLYVDDDLAARHARGYWAGAWSDRPALEPALDPELIHACGGLHSCVEDLARWLSQQFRTGRDLVRGERQVLAGRSLAEMHRQTILAFDAWDAAQGIGWSSRRRDRTILVGHAGGLDGWNTRIGFDAASKLGVIVLTNYGEADSSTLVLDIADLVAPIAKVVAAGAGGHAVPPPVPAAWSEYLGAYAQRHTLRQQVGVETLDGQLVLTNWGPTTVRLAPTEHPAVFVAESGRYCGEQLTFYRDDLGAVVRLMLGAEPADRVDWIRPMDVGGLRRA